MKAEDRKNSVCPKQCKSIEKKPTDMTKEDTSRPGKKWKKADNGSPLRQPRTTFLHRDGISASGASGVTKKRVHRRKNCVCRTFIDEVPCSGAKQSPNLVSCCFEDICANNQMQWCLNIVEIMQKCMSHRTHAEIWIFWDVLGCLALEHVLRSAGCWISWCIHVWLSPHGCHGLVKQHVMAWQWLQCSCQAMILRHHFFCWSFEDGFPWSRIWESAY